MVDAEVEGRRTVEKVHRSKQLQTVEVSKAIVKDHRIFDAR